MTPSEQLHHAIQEIHDYDVARALEIIADHLFPGRDDVGAIEYAETAPPPDPAKQELDTAQICWTAFQLLAPAARVRVLDWLTAHVAPEPEASAPPAVAQNIVCEGEAAAQLDPLDLAGHTPDTAHAVVRAAGLEAVGFELPEGAELVAESSSMAGECESLWSTGWLLHPASSELCPVQVVLTVTVDSSDGYKITRAELATQAV